MITNTNKTTSTTPIKVMVVDDALVIRGLVTRFLEQEGDLEVVSSVGDGERALQALDRHPVDVVVLDIEMPRMDGLTALPKIIEKVPGIQVLMASTLTRRNAEVSLKALSLGAADYIPKPTSNSEIGGKEEFKRDLITKVRALGKTGQRRRAHRERIQAGTADTTAKRGTSAFARQEKISSAQTSATNAPASFRAASSTSPMRDRIATATQDSRLKRSISAASTTTSPASKEKASKSLYSNEVVLRPAKSMMPDVIAIGSSTGGPQALFAVLSALKPDVKQPILITQHMPPTFTTILAEHVSKASGRVTKEAVEGDVIEAGKIYIAPGDYHMRVKSNGLKKTLHIDQGPQENFCRPAVDPMLRSIVEAYGGNVLTVILTGMGADGRKGCEQIISAGGQVIAQDEETSVVWGMPGAVASAGLCSAILPISEIGNKISSYATGGPV